MAERRRHPEATADEVHLGNVYGSDFARVGWATKRLGKIPRSPDDCQPLKGGNMRPVFVARAEMEAAGVPIPASGPIDHRW